jgi:hypothetical protein
MALTRNDKGPEVERLQQALIDLGGDLPRYGVDGWLGTETLRALERLLEEHDRQFDTDADAVSDEELAFVFDLHASVKGSLQRPVPDDRFFDMRSLAGTKHDYGERSWSKVTGVCLHQTACVLGEKPERWATVGAHVGITRAGKVIHLHDFNRLIVHGNGWNTQCVGIEMDGTYAGVEGDDRTFWRPASDPGRKAQSPTPELVDAATAAIRWIAAVIESHGGRVNAIVAHRQASKDRQSDPGSALWKAVALPLHAELKVTDGGVGFKLGTGYAIPEAWDPRCKGIRY